MVQVQRFSALVGQWKFALRGKGQIIFCMTWPIKQEDVRERCEDNYLDK